MDWPWTSHKDRVLNKVEKRLGDVEKIMSEDIEDDRLDAIMDRMERIETLLSPEPEHIEHASQFAGIWEKIPRAYRGLADMGCKAVTGISLKEALEDGTGEKMKKIVDSVGPRFPQLIETFGKYLPKELQASLTSQGSQGNSSSGSQGFDPYKTPPQ